MDETAIYEFSSVSKFNRNLEPLTTGHLHNSKTSSYEKKVPSHGVPVKCETKSKRNEIETK
jgi:hypothetical protein